MSDTVRSEGFFERLRKVQWLNATADRLVPQTAYLQVVFTVPDRLAPLFAAKNQWELGREFRRSLQRRISQLIAIGDLQLPKKLQKLSDTKYRQDWLKDTAKNGYRVYVQAAPKISGSQCTPRRVLGYLAAYVGGGPISDGRMLRGGSRESCRVGQSLRN